MDPDQSAGLGVRQRGLASPVTRSFARAWPRRNACGSALRPAERDPGRPPRLSRTGSVGMPANRCSLRGKGVAHHGWFRSARRTGHGRGPQHGIITSARGPKAMRQVHADHDHLCHRAAGQRRDHRRHRHRVAADGGGQNHADGAAGGTDAGPRKWRASPAQARRRRVAPRASSAAPASSSALGSGTCPCCCAVPASTFCAPPMTGG